MSITRLPPSEGTIHVEAEISIGQRDEFDRPMAESVAGERPRMDALVHDETSIHMPTMHALLTIEAFINAHPTSGQSKRLGRFLAGVYNGQDYPFDLTELRALDTWLANACLDHLAFDRLDKSEVRKHLAHGDRDLHRWIEEYRVEPAIHRP